MNAMALLKNPTIKNAAKSAEKFLPKPIRKMIRKRIAPDSVPSPLPGPLAVAIEGNSLNCILMYLESPEKLPEDEKFEIKGWFASPVEVFEAQSGSVLLKLSKRSDVADAYQDLPYVYGFSGSVGREAVLENSVIVDFHLKDTIVHQAFPRKLSKAQTKNLRAQRHQKISKFIKCPKSGSKLPNDFSLPTKNKILIEDTEMGFDPAFGCFDFLPEDFKKEFKVEETENVSANDYDPLANALISEHHDGLILDCGAGYRSFTYPNVVNFEIVPYDSTDVLGVNERLPFEDNTFDCVFSFAVLEHVKDPWNSAKEISRVLKPGGTLLAVVPFLQPRHGYPNHFYNMTNEGLKNLFEKEIEIERADVLPSGLPIWSLSWILNNWTQGLQGQTKQDFLNMKIGDLLNEPVSYLKAPFVTELSDDKNLEIASTTLVLGRKR